MTEIKTVEDFYAMVTKVAIPERAADLRTDPLSDFSAEVVAFAGYALETLEAESWTSESQQVFFRGKLGKPAREVALYTYSLLEEEGALHLFAFHYDPEPAAPVTLEQRVIEREKTRLQNLVELLRYDQTFRPESVKDEGAVQHLARIQKFLRSEKCKVIKYVVVTNHLKKERNRPEKTVAGKVFVEVVDIERLFRWSRGVASRSEIEVTVSEVLGSERLIALRAPDTNEDVTTFLTVLPGRFLAELYENYDSRLLELNVRSYLSAKGGVNKGIQDTLRDPEKRRFFLPYNNGIVVVVEELQADDVSAGVAALKWFRGFQIVNGGQTTASLFKASRDARNGNVLQDVYVQAKIIRLNKASKVEEIVKSISRYANSQNKVEMADLGANEAYHRRVEKLAAKEQDPKFGKYWFYERMRNSYATQLMVESSPKKWQQLHPKDRVITKTDLAKYLMAWDRQPAAVARGGQKCFNAFAQSYHVKPIRTDAVAEIEVTSERFKEIIGKALVYRTTHHIVRSNKDLFKSNQINVATYTVAYLSRRVGGALDWKAIWRNQSLTEEMSAVLHEYAVHVARFLEQAAAGRLASEVSKREGLFEDLWRELSELKLPADEAGVAILPIEMRGHLDAAEESIDPEDERTVAEVMAYSLDHFQAVRKAAETNAEVVSEHHVEVLRELESQSRGGWVERPKPKHAKMFLHASAQLENRGLIQVAAA